MNRATIPGKANLHNFNRRQSVNEKPLGNVISMAGTGRKVEPPPFDDSNPPLFLQLRSGAWIAVSLSDIYSLKAPEDSWGKVELWITRGSYYRGMEACFQDDQPTTKGEKSLTAAVRLGGGSTGG